MPIALEPPDDHNDDHDSGTDLSSLFRVLIRGVQGIEQAQKDTKDLLARSLAMKETFTTNPKTQTEARKIREKVQAHEPSSKRRTEDSIDGGQSKVAPQGPQHDLTAGYTKAVKGALGPAVPHSLKQAVTHPLGTAQNFGLDLAKQLGSSARSTVFQNWEKRDRAEAARQRGHTVPADVDDRVEKPRKKRAQPEPSPAPPEEVRPKVTYDGKYGGKKPTVPNWAMPRVQDDASYSRGKDEQIAPVKKSDETSYSPISKAQKPASSEAPKEEERPELDDKKGDTKKFKRLRHDNKIPANNEVEEDTAYRKNQPTNGGSFDGMRKASGSVGEDYKSPPPPNMGKTWGYNTASPGGPTGYTPGSPNGPYGPYGRYGTSSTTGGGGGGGGGGGSDPLGDGGGGGGGSSQNGSYGENSGIGGWAKKNIPGVSMLFGAADEVKSQRNKNAYYQNIEGGSNLGGVSERAHEEAYAATAGGFGGAFSEQEAREAFKGVTRIGYNGKEGSQFSTQGGRQDALNYAYHAKTSYGADVSESLRQLETASKDATINLNDLQNSMKGVSDAAGKAGVNSQMARQNLMNLIQTGQQQGMTGAAAQNIASPIAQGQASMGRDFESYSYAGQMSSGVQYIQAAEAGISKGQLTQLATDNPLKYQQIATGNKVQQIGNLPQDIQNAIQAALKDNKGTVDEPTARQMAQKILQQYPDYNNSAYWQGYITTTGADPKGNPLLWLTDAIMTVAGQDPQLKAAQKATDAQPTSIAKTDSTSKLPTGVTSSSQGYADDKTEKTWSKQQDESGHATVKALAADEKTGGRNRVLEGIMQNQPDADHSNVEVHTASGVRVVSLADAMKNHPEELQAGDVKFTSGANKGKTVSDLVGSANVNTKADWSKEAKKKDDSGQSLADYTKDNPNDTSGKGTGANGKVLVDLTDAAKKLLNVTTTGIASSADAAGQGAPVTNDYSTNATRDGTYGGAK